MKGYLMVLMASLIGITSLTYATDFSNLPDTWANWDKKFDDAAEEVPPRKLPGRGMGIVVPADTRDDILPMSSFAYQVLDNDSIQTAVIIMQAPSNYELNGLAVPGIDVLETNFGDFFIDQGLRNNITNGPFPAKVDPDLFALELPKLLLTQLAALRHHYKKGISRMKILPVYVRFSDVNSQSKDYAPFLVDRIRDYGIEKDIFFFICANLTRAPSPEVLIRADKVSLKAMRELDVDALINIKGAEGTTQEWSDSLILGLLTLRTLGGDHTEIFSYANSAQLVLTKDKKSPLSYVSAGIASGPTITPFIPHVSQEKMVDIFGELLRADILALTRQTLLSTVDTTAAKPPALNHKDAAKRWPVYVSIYNSSGTLAGQAGATVPYWPLEESLRRYTVEAVHKAEPGLNKTNAASHVVDISIPYGFEKVKQADDYVPLLNGMIVAYKHKTTSMHPDAWRVYPDIHPLLSAVCFQLGFKPWSYALDNAKLGSFRIFSFNEKEPFQDLVGTSKKKKKKKDGDSFDDLGDTGGGGGGGGNTPFGF